VSDDPPIRVMLMELPRLLESMLEAALATEPGLELIGAGPGPPAAEDRELPDLIIVGLRAGRLPSSVERLLRDRATPRVLGVEAEDARACLYELRPQATSLGQLTVDELPRLIRGAARSA
jgi:hypothetical protein